MDATDATELIEVIEKAALVLRKEQNEVNESIDMMESIPPTENMEYIAETDPTDLQHRDSFFFGVAKTDSFDSVSGSFGPTTCPRTKISGSYGDSYVPLLSLNFVLSLLVRRVAALSVVDSILLCCFGIEGGKVCAWLVLMSLCLL